VSAAILGAATAAWGLFEVAEYHFLTLACYAAMIAMLTFFIWTNASAFLNMYEHPFVLSSYCSVSDIWAEIHCNTTLWQNSSSCNAGMIAN
jgi:hypothetical protein